MRRILKIQVCICGLLLLFACKKNYSCDCKTIVVDSRPPSTTKTSRSSQPLGAKMTDNEAASACESIKRQLRDNFSQQLVSVSEVSVFVSCNVN